MKKKKDVAFLCQFFYPEYISSATLPYDVAQELVKRGCSVGALVGYPKEYSNDVDVPKRETHNGIDIKRVKYIQTQRTGLVGRLVNFVSFFGAVLLNIFFLKDYKVVVVYSNPPILPLIGRLAQKMFKTKLIFVSFDVYPELAIKSGSITENGMMARIFRLTNNILFKSVDKVVAVCADMKEFLAENRDIVPDKIVDIPSWYQDNRGISKTNLNKEVFTVSYLGNMGTCQDETTIMNTIELMKDDTSVRFLFAGHGNKLGRIKNAKQERCWDNVIIHDFLQGEAFEQVLEESDCFVVSLVEGLYGLCAPSKTYTYFMKGRPIICIMDERTEIAKDIMTYNAGRVFEIGNAEEIVAYINYLKMDKKMYDAISKNSRKIYVDKYQQDICLEKFCKEIQSLL